MRTPFACSSLVAFLAALAFAACGGRLAAESDGGTTGGRDGSPNPEPGLDGGPLPSFDSGPTPGVDGGPQPPPPPPQFDHYGSIILESNPPGSNQGTYATASFFDATSSLCAFVTPTSGCAIVECGNATSGAESAGTITVGGGTQTITLSPSGGPNGAYNTFNSPQQIFIAGKTITVKATGGAVPAFASTLTFPGDVKVFEPTITQNQPTVIDTTRDLVVAWSNGGVPPRELLFFLQADNGNGAVVALSCFFDAAATKSVVPASTLANFKAKAAGSRNTFVLVFPTTRALAAAGNWGVELVAVGAGPFGPATVR